LNDYDIGEKLVNERIVTRLELKMLGDDGILDEQEINQLLTARRALIVIEDRIAKREAEVAERMRPKTALDRIRRGLGGTPAPVVTTENGNVDGLHGVGRIKAALRTRAA